MSRPKCAICSLSMWSCETTEPRTPPHPPGLEPGRVFSRSIIEARPDNAAPYRCEIEYAAGDTVSFDVQIGNRKTMPAVGLEGDDAITGIGLTLIPTGEVTYS